MTNVTRHRHLWALGSESSERKDSQETFLFSKIPRILLEALTLLGGWNLTLGLFSHRVILVTTG